MARSNCGPNLFLIHRANYVGGEFVAAQLVRELDHPQTKRARTEDLDRPDYKRNLHRGYKSQLSILQIVAQSDRCDL